MRQIGTLPTEEQAQLFNDYLLTKNIKSRIDPEEGQWVLWAIDEDELDQAKTELAEFVQNPDDSRYANATAEATRRRKQEQKEEEKARKNFVDVRNHWQRPLMKRCPITFGLIAISVAVAILSRLGEQHEPVISSLSIASYQIQGSYVLWSGLSDIKHGQLWRLVTPMFIHFGPLHILMNMFALKYFGDMIESRIGNFRMVILVLTISAISNLGEYFMNIFQSSPGPTFGGMSGVIFGLFGYIWIKSRYDFQENWYLHPNTVMMVVVWYLLCMVGVIGNIANTAHTVGLAVGALIAYAPIMLRNQRFR